MANPNPSPATRFQPRVSGNPGGRPNRRFVSRILREQDPAGLPARERMVRHLVELATSYTVIVAGRDLELASGRDSVEAAKLLLAYDLGTPPKMEKLIPAVDIGPGKSLLEIAMAIYRQKLASGKMTESELAEMVRLLLAAEKDKALIFLKALGSKLQTLQSQQIDRLLAAYEQDPAGFLGFVSEKVPEPDAMEVTPVAPIEEVAPVVAKEAKRAAEAQGSGQAMDCESSSDEPACGGETPSPKDRDTADHGSTNAGPPDDDEDDE